MALRNRRLAALAFFVGMAVLHSWPLASDPAHLARLDNDDAALNTWVIAWVAHIAAARSAAACSRRRSSIPSTTRSPTRSTCSSQSVMGAPLLWSGASPVLVYNLLIIAGLALSGWSMYLLMRAMDRQRLGRHRRRA